MNTYIFKANVNTSHTHNARVKDPQLNMAKVEWKKREKQACVCVQSVPPQHTNSLMENAYDCIYLVSN